MTRAPAWANRRAVARPVPPPLEPVKIVSGPSLQTSKLARFVAGADTARRLFDALGETFMTGENAVATFEEAGAWVVEIYFRRPPDEDAVRTLVRSIADNAISERLVFTSIAARDWIAQSLEGLAPVTAGRFVIHGAHDRHRVPPNRIGID